MWTQFHDMHSGGDLKTEFAHIFIEAPEDEARRVFNARFGRNPDNVTCHCCGNDYSVSEHESLDQATAYERNCDFAYFRPDGTECPREEGWKAGLGHPSGYQSRYVERQEVRAQYETKDDCGLYVSLGDALKRGRFGRGQKFLVIYTKDITPEERTGPKGRRREYVYQEVEE